MAGKAPSEMTFDELKARKAELYALLGTVDVMSEERSEIVHQLDAVNREIFWRNA